ncbi:MAG: hypothetical protein AAGB48_08090 [Planctomycetota bacterium]
MSIQSAITPLGGGSGGPTGSGAGPGLGQGVGLDPMRTQGVRELFWQNVIREMLTSLSTAAMAREAQVAAAQRREMTSRVDTPEGPVSEVTIREPVPEDTLFDGRLAVMTTSGTRIPIGGVTPLFACGIDTSSHERSLSMAVECSVFQIRTPTGEMYTLPLHEIRGFHALTPELVDTLRAQAGVGRIEQPDEPFGFAAFTSLAREAEAHVSTENGSGPA